VAVFVVCEVFTFQISEGGRVRSQPCRCHCAALTKLYVLFPECDDLVSQIQSASIVCAMKGGHLSSHCPSTSRSSTRKYPLSSL
jgi:hypothetical protein